MSKFKVGDKVKIIVQDKGVNNLKKGYVGVITIVDESDQRLTYKVDNQWCITSQLELVSDKQTECSSLDYEVEYNHLREELGNTKAQLSIALDIIEKLSMLINND